jgi:Rrf2 family transcriptional regulator, cysteine metabolism repressor
VKMTSPSRLGSRRESRFGATMRISAKAEYACLAVIELARTGGDGSPTRVRELAVAQNIPERYLIQILLQLKAAGLVHSSRGSVGGYQLARPPSETSVGEVIAAIDGRGKPLRKSRSEAARGLSDLLDRAGAAAWGVLASSSIADLAGIGIPDDVRP